MRKNIEIKMLEYKGLASKQTSGCILLAEQKCQVF